MKLLRYSIASILFISLLVFIVAFLRIDTIVRNAIINNGSELLGANINLKSVQLELTNGTLELHDLTIKNPKGFKQSLAITIPKIQVKAKINKLFQTPIVINEIKALSPTINLELNNKSNNISVIRHNAKHNSSTETSKQKSVIINKIIIRNIQVRADLNLIQQDYKLGDLVINKASDNLSSPEIINQILSQIIKKVEQEHGISLNKINPAHKIKELSQNFSKKAKKRASSFLLNTLKKVL